MTTKRKNKNAFTLIEMAVVLVIIGLILGLVFPIVTGFIKQEKISDNRDYVEKIKNEIIGFALINKRLPTDLDEIGVGQDPYGNTLRYERPDDLTTGDLCDAASNSPITVQELSGIGGAVNQEYTNIAFVLSSAGRNLTEEILVNGATFTIYDPVGYGASTAGVVDEFDDAVEFVSYNYLKSKVCTNTQSQSFTPSGSDASFAQNIGDFTGSATGIDPPGSATGAVTVNVDNNTVELGNSVTTGTDSAGCVWYQGSAANCTNGLCDSDEGYRAFFTFKSAPGEASGAADSQTVGYGFTFATMDGGPNSAASCGGGGATGVTGHNGYAGIIPAYPGGIVPEKFAVEFDFHSQATFDADAPNRVPGNDTDNHVAMIYWGDAAVGTRGNDNTHDFTVNNGAADPGLGHGDVNVTTPQVNPTQLNPNAFYNSILPGTLPTSWEDGLEYSVRFEVSRVENATIDYIDTEIWVLQCGTQNCTSLSDLTGDFTGNNTINGDANSTSAYLTHRMYIANIETAMDKVYFGWTTENKPGNQFIISNFGINMLP